MRQQRVDWGLKNVRKCLEFGIFMMLWQKNTIANFRNGALANEAVNMEERAGFRRGIIALWSQHNIPNRPYVTNKMKIVEPIKRTLLGTDYISLARNLWMLLHIRNKFRCPIYWSWVQWQICRSKYLIFWWRANSTKPSNCFSRKSEFHVVIHYESL